MYLFKYNIEKVARNFEENKDVLIKLNLIETYNFFISTNIEFFTKNPEVYLFLSQAMINSPEPIKILLQKKKREMQGFVINSIIKNIETSYFRENVDKEKVEFLILTLLDTLSNKYIEKYKGDLELLKADTENRNKEIEGYIDLIKFGILRREEK
jgi:TetR/AcrR family transcriptional regulator